MRTLRAVFVLAAIALVFGGGYGYGRWYGTRPAAARGRKILYYVDAMHPWYKSDNPGIAPDCGMQLTPVYSDGTTGDAGADHQKIVAYRDPQDHSYTSDKPGLNPSTGNDLEPIYGDAVPSSAIQITPEKQQMMGVRFGQVEWTTNSQSIHAAGKVMADETLITRIQARTDGWIAKVYADFTGKRIEKDQPLLTLYSPELLAAQQEYLLALKAGAIMQHSSMSESMANSSALLEASRRRLLLLNFSSDDIGEIAQSQKPIENITIHSTAAGYVMSRNAWPGQRVTPETELYTIANLDCVWVLADVFESDAARIHLGQPARVSIPGTNGSHFARVTYMQPQADSVTRTIKVRLELTNERMQFRPDMFVDVAIDFGSGRTVTVPADAVLDSGLTKTVFLDKGNGYIEPRSVQTGERSAERVEILSGLKPGDRIVTSGVFLLNSETQMKQSAGGAEENHDQPHH